MKNMFGSNMPAFHVTQNEASVPSGDAHDLSIVVQGACSETTSLCIQSLRGVFPKAEIILSTWLGSEVEALAVDRIVLSPDPGAVYADKVSGTWNNVNRQLMSTRAGLAAATRTFVLKTRSDILFHNSNFLSYFGKYDQIPSSYFKNRLLICNYYTRNPQVFKICFHPSDWILFGRKEDVVHYYQNIPFMTNEEGEWFCAYPKMATLFTNYLCRYTPEQHIFLNFLAQYQPIQCDCYYERSRKLVKQTEQAFADCFVVLDYQRQLSITFSKYDPNRYFEKYTLISHWQWKAIYQHYYRNTPSFGWGCYRARIFILLFFTHIRIICIQILEFMGIKEYVKDLLSRFRKQTLI